MLRVTLLLLVCSLAAVCPANALATRGGQLQVKVIDRDTKQPIACRMHLRNAVGRPQKVLKALYFQDHIIIDGEATLRLPPGNYTFELERGPEYLRRTGHFSIADFADDSQVLDLKRFANMAEEGWWSGDLLVARPLKDIELLMRAEDLHVAQVVTWPSQKQGATRAQAAIPAVKTFDAKRYYSPLAGLRTWEGGSVLLLNLQQPLAGSKAGGNYAQAADLIAAARAAKDAWIDLAYAPAWDLPVLIAEGKLSSIEIADARLTRIGVQKEKGGLKPPDGLGFAGAAGAARWSEAVYYHLLNCGIQLPPTAGSGSGTTSNPVGYNRVYVHAGDDLSYDSWWRNLRAGRAVVTNGPLIRPNVEGQLPGHTFTAEPGQQIELEVGLKMASRDQIEYLEVIKDGAPAYSARLADFAAAGGRLPRLKFDRSGWFLIRATCDAEGISRPAVDGSNNVEVARHSAKPLKTYRFAMTAPYYVQVGYQPRISRSSVQFFLDWLKVREEQITGPGKPADAEMQKHFQAAQRFWQDLLAKANAE